MANLPATDSLGLCTIKQLLHEFPSNHSNGSAPHIDTWHLRWWVNSVTMSALKPWDNTIEYHVEMQISGSISNLQRD